MEGYLRAASQISRARGRRPQRERRRRSPTRSAATASQMRARRRRAVRHARRHLGRAHLPGRRRLRRSRSMLHDEPLGELFGSTSMTRWTNEQIEVSIDGERVALLDVDARMSETDPKNGLDAHDAADPRHGGPAARGGGVHPALRRPGRRPDRADRAHAGRHQIGIGFGITTLPHLRDLAIAGPFAGDRRVRHAEPPARSSPAGRRRAAEEAAVRRRRSSSGWRRRRIRGPVDARRPRRTLMAFYDAGRARTAASRRASAWRSRRSSRARTSCSASRRRRRRRAPGRPTASPTSTWRRACRSSSGARRRTRSC